jgi:prepilin-type N-terminal cleavage/methylation domain-containing protein
VEGAEDLKTVTRAAELDIVQGRAGAPRPTGDDGFTILEVVIALALILFIMSALSPLFYTSIKTALLSNARSQATAIATKELESMRVSPYDEVGFYEDQPGYSANCDPTDPSLETVSLGPTAPADPIYLPTGTVTVQGSSTEFEYTKCIAWVDGVDSAGAPLAQAYKKTYVTVTWENQGRTSTISQASIVYPGGLGGYSGPKNVGGGTGGGGTVTAPATPTNVVVTPPAAPASNSQLDVTWQNGGGTVDHYVVDWSTDFAFTTVAGTSGNLTGQSYSAGGLSAGTTYWFRVQAFGDSSTTYASGKTVPVSGTTTNTAPPATCTVGNLGLTMASGSTTKTYLNQAPDKDRLMEEATFSANFSSVCGSGYHVRAFDAGGNQVTTTWSFPATGSVRTTTTAWSGTKLLDKGIYTFTIYNGSVSTSQSHTLLVCDYKAPAARSTDANTC